MCGRFAPSITEGGGDHAVRNQVTHDHYIVQLIQKYAPDAVGFTIEQQRSSLAGMRTHSRHSEIPVMTHRSDSDTMAIRRTQEATRGFAPNPTAYQPYNLRRPAVITASCTGTRNVWFIAAAALILTSLTCATALEGIQVQTDTGSLTPAVSRLKLTSPHEESPRMSPTETPEGTPGLAPRIAASSLDTTLTHAATVGPGEAAVRAARITAPHKQPPHVDVLLRRVAPSDSVAASSALAAQQLSNQKVSAYFDLKVFQTKLRTPLPAANRDADTCQGLPSAWTPPYNSQFYSNIYNMRSRTIYKGLSDLTPLIFTLATHLQP